MPAGVPLCRKGMERAGLPVPEEVSPPLTQRAPHPTALRRGSAALRPDPVRGRTENRGVEHNRDDPHHPLRGGGARKRAFAPRPARTKGSQPWLARRLDESGYQHRALYGAFLLYYDANERVGFCRAQKLSGKYDPRLPLKARRKGPACTDEACRCKPHFVQLVGANGGVGSGKPEFVSQLFATWRASAR